MNRKTFTLSIALIAAILIFKSIVPGSSPATQINQVSPSPSDQPKTQTTLVIDYGNGEKSTHIRQFSSDQSAFSMLRSITEEKQIPLEYKEYSIGTMVESIKEIKNNSTHAWIYFVNSSSPEIGADRYRVRPGDVIEWKYISPK